MKCKHDKTIIWEPHLAGARKCLGCGMVFNPNHDPNWFFEEPLLQESYDKLKAELELTKEPLQIAQGILTCLNVGAIQSESLLHIELRRVMINYRAEKGKLNA